MSTDGQLLIGGRDSKQLHIHSIDGSHVTSVNLPDDDKIQCAEWTPSGHIVYTTMHERLIVTTVSGDIIARNPMQHPQCVSVTRNLIYVADRYNGVYQSVNDGVNWTHVTKPADGWFSWQAIKVLTDSHSKTYDLWVTEYNNSGYWHLRVYTLERHLATGNITWRDANVPTNVNLLNCTQVFYFAHENIYLLDAQNFAVHVWSASGQYCGRLLSAKSFFYGLPMSIEVSDKYGDVMYFGCFSSIIKVFNLLYNDSWQIENPPV